MYRKHTAKVAVTVEVVIEVEALICEWPTPVPFEIQQRLIDAARHEIATNPPKLDISKASLEIISRTKSER